MATTQKRDKQRWTDYKNKDDLQDSQPEQDEQDTEEKETHSNPIQERLEDRDLPIPTEDDLDSLLVDEDSNNYRDFEGESVVTDRDLAVVKWRIENWTPTHWATYFREFREEIREIQGVYKGHK